MLVGRPVAMHPRFVPATGSQVIEVALTVTPPPGVQFVILAVPTGVAMALLQTPNKAIAPRRKICFLSPFIVLPPPSLSVGFGAHLFSCTDYHDSSLEYKK